MRSAAWRLPFVIALTSCVHSGIAPTPLRDDRAALRSVIDSLLALPDTRSARWGVLVVDPQIGDTLYARDAGKLFVPASNMKIATSAVALDALGPDFRFATPFVYRGVLTNGVLRGDVVVVGRGDPTISDHVAGDAMLPLRAVADSLWTRGIRRVAGRILADTMAFPDANVGFGWQFEDLDYSYGAMIDELLFNEGFSQIHVRAASKPGDSLQVATSPAKTFPSLRVIAQTVARGVGPDSVARLQAVKDTLRGDVVVSGTIPAGDTVTLEVTHSNPVRAFVLAFREALRDRGITIGDSVIPMPSAARLDSVTLYSPPLSQILPAFLKPSQNQIGEMLFKTIALQRTDTGSAAIARRLVAEKLREWGAAPDGFLVWDGSGLSRRDLISPETIVHILDAMRRSPHFQVYFDALPVAGIDGTVSGRMRSTAAEANVRSKTGTLGNVRSLSGYVTTVEGRLLLFSILCNNYLVPTANISRVQDTIAVRLARLRRGGGGAR